MKYKVGDKVRIKSIDWYNENQSEGYVDVDGIFFIYDMVKYCGKILTITNIEPENYVMQNCPYAWSDEMIEGLVEEEEIEFTEVDKYWCDIMSESDPTTYVLPQGYIFKDENGNVINATKIVLEKKKKEYPKTYEECCKVLDIEDRELVFNGEYRASKLYWKQLGRLNILNKILICRDAYWKIAGEEMELGKPWEPDYRYKDEYYSIYYNGFGIIQCNSFQAHVFIFPTAEMRDAFYENFKEEIEQCKELL